MKKITVDKKRCRGLHLCHRCEAVQPGLALACGRFGHVIVQDWAARDNSAMISQLIQTCPDRAIMIMEVQ